MSTSTISRQQGCVYNRRRRWSIEPGIYKLFGFLFIKSLAHLIPSFPHPSRGSWRWRLPKPAMPTPRERPTRRASMTSRALTRPSTLRLAPLRSSSTLTRTIRPARKSAPTFPMSTTRPCPSTRCACGPLVFSSLSSGPASTSSSPCGTPASASHRWWPSSSRSPSAAP